MKTLHTHKSTPALCGIAVLCLSTITMAPLVARAAGNGSDSSGPIPGNNVPHHNGSDTSGAQPTDINNLTSRMPLARFGTAYSASAANAQYAASTGLANLPELSDALTAASSLTQALQSASTNGATPEERVAVASAIAALRTALREDLGKVIASAPHSTPAQRAELSAALNWAAGEVVLLESLPPA